MEILRGTRHRFFLVYLLCLPCTDCLPGGNDAAEGGPVPRSGNDALKNPRFADPEAVDRDRGTRPTKNASTIVLRSTDAHQGCTGFHEENGRCEYPRRCRDADVSDSGLFSSRACTIDGTYLGVCCRSDGEPARRDLLEEKSLASVLPVIAVGEPSEDDGPPMEDPRRNGRGPRGCGMSLKSRTRLVGGRPADPREWPWMAALLRREVGQYCGGVLITDRHVLTAAHCVYRYKPRDVKVRLGEYDFTTREETRALDFTAAEIRVHEEFDYTSYENDIAIVKINRPTVFNGYIWPVCLPPVQKSFENKTAIVTGWGTQYYGGPASTVLMEVAVPIWPQEKCVRSFVQRIPGTTMCAGGYEGGRDACQGDSGGPLLHQLANGRWVNIGIVSWGIRCGEPGHPGIYTRVNGYLDWIFANAVF